MQASRWITASLSNQFIQWNSGWPVEVTTDFVKSLQTGASSKSEPQSILGQYIGTTSSDKLHLSNLATLSGTQKPIYIAAVSPWFFTHYSPETFDKNVSLERLSLKFPQGY